MSKIMGKLQTVFVVANFILIFATIIALPIGARHNRNDGHYIFAQTENSTTWPTGWAFMLAWLSPIWTIGGFDSCRCISRSTPPITFPLKFLLRRRHADSEPYRCTHERGSSQRDQSCCMFKKNLFCKSMDTDVILTAFWYSHGRWILLVLRLHHRDCACCMYQPRSKLSHWIEVWPANGAGKSTSRSPLSPRTLT